MTQRFHDASHPGCFSKTTRGKNNASSLKRPPMGPWDVHGDFPAFHGSKNFPTDPCFAYPKPPGPTVYGSEFLSFGGVYGWGMLQVYVGAPLEW